MILYHRWKCPWSAAARQAIENVGVEVELVEVPYPRKERQQVAALTGQRRIPVLVDGDDVIVDSRPIVRHLYRRYGGERYARSIMELTQDMGKEGGPPEAAEVCELPPADRAA